MKTELLQQKITETNLQERHAELIAPGMLSPEETADSLIGLLQTMYTAHAITNRRTQLTSEIASGKVLTWFARKGGKLIATASLVDQGNGSMEIGRAVSTSRGDGIGKHLILRALEYHIQHNQDKPVIAEVRSAVDFMGIPSGLATQRIFLGLLNNIVDMSPYALVPLFAHGDPLRNESFILAASDAPKTTPEEQIREALYGRSTKGTLSRLKIVQHEPFQLIIPDENGFDIKNALEVSRSHTGCTLFPIEATDKNMPLIGNLSRQNGMVVCGIDREKGPSGKPVVFIATLGINTTLAPSNISEVLPEKTRKELEQIARRFEKNG